MGIVLYLAMTAAEFDIHRSRPCPLAWMACHFSSYGTGLSNLPPALPKGSLLILNDRTPVFGHDPERIAQQLSKIATQFDCDGILLDFQRPDELQTKAIVEAIISLSQPVAVTPFYAQHLDCPVFLPPPPLTHPLEDHLRPWQGREIWMEAALEDQHIRLDHAGSHILSEWSLHDSFPHTDEHLHCIYRTEVQMHHIDFFLRRNEAQLHRLLEEAVKLGVHRFVGLYQQLGSSFAQYVAADTARFQA